MSALTHVGSGKAAILTIRIAISGKRSEDAVFPLRFREPGAQVQRPCFERPGRILGQPKLLSQALDFVGGAVAFDTEATQPRDACSG
jgi:hypothetical protein